MGIQIRSAAPEDASAACAVLRRSIRECCVQDHQNNSNVLDTWLGNKTPQTVAGWLASPTNYTVVAERDGEVVGVALLTQAGKLSLCYVLPEAQRSGIGKALLEGVEAKARDWGIGVVKLHCTALRPGGFSSRATATSMPARKRAVLASTATCSGSSSMRRPMPPPRASATAASRNPEFVVVRASAAL